MAADLGLIAHTAQGHAHELTVCGACNRLPKRGLTHSGRTDQTQNGCFDAIDSLLNREVFQDTLFNLIQTIVVFVQYFLGVSQVIVDLALLAPWQVDQGIDEVTDDGCLSRHRRHEF